MDGTLENPIAKYSDIITHEEFRSDDQDRLL